jgi:hypothetical protein
VRLLLIDGDDGNDIDVVDDVDDAAGNGKSDANGDDGRLVDIRRLILFGDISLIFIAVLPLFLVTTSGD